MACTEKVVNMKNKSETLNDIAQLQDYLWHIDIPVSYHSALAKLRKAIAEQDPPKK